MEFELLKAIKENGLTQKEFATIVGDDPSVVSRIINGVWIPDGMRKIRYARALKMKIEELWSEAEEGR